VRQEYVITAVIQYNLILTGRTLIVLRISPTDVDASQTKLFLLLQTERYADALVLASDQDKHAFERAYALYRLQREDEARPILDILKDSSGSQERGIHHLEAQMVW
jgi:signal recognition particle subunit SRP72